MTQVRYMPIDTNALRQLSPGALDTIKLIALLSMLTDHINTLLLPQMNPCLYAIGRMAFPLFALIWALNVGRYPERLQHRANRLWLWGVITQPIFWLAFHHQLPWYALNILFVFAGVTQFFALQYRFGKAGVIAGLILLGMLLYPLRPGSFGFAGITLTMSLATLFSTPIPVQRYCAAAGALVSLVFLNEITWLLERPADTLLLATLPTLVFPVAVVAFAEKVFPSGTRRFMSGQFFYLAYAGHLAFLGILAKLY